MAYMKDRSGEIYGYLLVLGLHGRSKDRHTLWLCKCQKCGNQSIVSSNQLTTGKTRSCGCIFYEKTKKANTIHGETINKKQSKTYQSWASMIDRCLNPNNKKFMYYGGKNIKVCKRWRDFQNFYADMGEKPNGKTLDRIDSDGNYEPLNCRWATRQEQAWNCRVKKGYSWIPRDKKYVAKITVRGHKKYLGYFDDPEKAHQEYLKAKRFYHFIDQRPEIVKRLHKLWSDFFTRMHTPR